MIVQLAAASVVKEATVVDSTAAKAEADSAAAKVVQDANGAIAPSADTAAAIVEIAAAVSTTDKVADKPSFLGMGVFFCDDGYRQSCN